ncbi:hypothetical protein FZ103_07045 [Streptomonospora sp. PA3]|uniref:hypothetical protein n=1 Tax=Streptomonospora sp. PA3 TaxID=2607326 RepID=UPI0012DF3245|nr:hypothetical protein [Streptomonospora sp. PA3]MUL40944.1 hypothetical protein [Streptomonospora sp. PA3]
MTSIETGTEELPLSGEDVLWSAWYLGGSECTLPGRLLPYFPADIRNERFDVPGVAAALADFAGSVPEGDQGEARAIALLARREASRMAGVLDDADARALIGRHADIDAGIRHALANTTEFLGSYGVDVGAPVVRVVDAFPEPYQDRRYAMLTADAGDQRKYGVAPGVYLRRAAVRPLYSEALVCHELIHVALGHQDPDLMGRGLEEGIAELVGSIMLSGRQVGVVPTYWIEVFNRRNHVYDTVWEHYNEFLRMTYMLYRRIGIDGLMSLVAAGRGRIKEVERDIVRGVDAVPDIETGWFDFGPEFDRIAERLVMGFPRSMVVSPVARVVADHAQPGTTVREIAAATGLEEEAVSEAVRELTEEATVIGRRADGLVVTSSDLDIYLPAGMLRYRL